MKCPNCQSDDTKVADSRIKPKSRYRRRVCQQCGERFSTTELYGNVTDEMPLLLPKIEKKNGKLENFDRSKLLQSITVAVRKAERATIPIETIVDSIENEVNHSPPGEPIKTNAIGTQVMKALQQNDWLAYVRYRTVHQPMKSDDDIRILIDELHQLLLKNQETPRDE